jgi:hypothetical protein
MPAQRYQLGGFTLAVHRTKKRIDVRAGKIENQDSLKIPKWIFESEDAIWIADGPAPLSVRVIRGEEIKRKISNEF